MLARIPTLEQEGLRGGVLYYDGQFDDSRLLIDLAQTADQQGAVLLNYAPVTRLAPRCRGLRRRPEVSSMPKPASTTISPPGASSTPPGRSAMRSATDGRSRGRADDRARARACIWCWTARFLPGDAAIMVPHTSDGRVMFAIPWHEHALMGTTDTPIEQVTLEPVPHGSGDRFHPGDGSPISIRTAEAQRHSQRLCRHSPAGEVSGSDQHRRAVARSYHSRCQDPDCSPSPAASGRPIARWPRTASITPPRWANWMIGPASRATLHIHGYHEHAEQLGDLGVYGSDAEEIEQLMRAKPEWAAALHDALPIWAAQVVWAVRHEMARTVDDVLARRTRALLLNAAAAIRIAPAVAKLMAVELQRDVYWEGEQVAEFMAMAKGYMFRGTGGVVKGI